MEIPASSPGAVGTPKSRQEGYLGEQPGQLGAELRWALVAALFDTFQHGHMVPRWSHRELGEHRVNSGSPRGVPVPPPGGPYLATGQGKEQDSQGPPVSCVAVGPPTQHLWGCEETG